MDASFTNIGIELKHKNIQASHLSGEGGVLLGAIFMVMGYAEQLS